MEYIYILKCQKEKYYIGKTYNVQIEYNEHLDGSFCNFTKEFKPCDIDGIFEVDKNIANLELVIAKYVNKYDKKSISFEETDVKLIKKILKTIHNKCICDSESHWLDSCKLNLKDEFWSKMFNKMLNNFTKNCRESNICCRCGRFGHFLDQCYAKKHNDGYDLSDEVDENEIDFIQ